MSNTNRLFKRVKGGEDLLELALNDPFYDGNMSSRSNELCFYEFCHESFSKIKNGDKVNLPLLPQTGSIARTNRDTTFLKGYYTWSGELDHEVYSRAVLTFNEKYLFGNIQIDEKVYEIRPVKDKIICVFKIDQAQLPTNECKSHHTRNSQDFWAQKRIDIAAKKFLSKPKRQKKLLVQFFLPGIFENHWSDKLELLEVYTEQHLQDIFIRHSLHDKPIKCKYTLLENHEESFVFHMGLDLLRRRFRQIDKGKFDSDADLFFLFSTKGGICGFADILPHNARSEGRTEKYAIVHSSCAFAKFSIAHELGHLFGLDHDRPNADHISSEHNNYGYVGKAASGKHYSTIMAYVSKDCNVESFRVGVFSDVSLPHHLNLKFGDDSLNGAHSIDQVVFAHDFTSNYAV